MQEECQSWTLSPVIVSLALIPLSPLPTSYCQLTNLLIIIAIRLNTFKCAPKLISFFMFSAAHREIYAGATMKTKQAGFWLFNFI